MIHLIKVFLLLFVCFPVFCQSIDDLAYKSIAERQAKFGAKKISMPIDSQIIDYKARYNKVAENISDRVQVTLSDSHIQLPRTAYESVVQRTHIEAVRKLGIKVLDKYSIDTSSVYFSFVLCPCFNAQSMPLVHENRKLKDKWLVEYNVGFSIFAQKISVFTANSCPSTGNLDSISLDSKEYASLITNPANYKLYESLYAFLLGDIASALNVESDSITLAKCKNPVMAASISDGVSAFTLYHELAHIILGHHAKINHMSIVDNAGKEVTVGIANYYKFEFAADSLGLEIMMNSLSQSDKINKSTNSVSVPYVFSPLIFFSWLNIFQSFEDTIAGTHRGIKSHPSAALRRAKILKQYEIKGIVNDDMNFADLIDGELRWMYDIIKGTMTDESIKRVKGLKLKAKECVFN